MRRLLATTCLVLAVTVLGGCPRDVETPDRNEGARACEVIEDCNGGLSCSAAPLYACVDGQCEADPSLIVPCPAGDAAP